MPDSGLPSNQPEHKPVDNSNNVTNATVQGNSGNEGPGVQDSKEAGPQGQQPNQPAEFLRPPDMDNNNTQKMSFENVTPMIPMPQFIPQMNHPMNMGQGPQPVLNHPGMPMHPMGHPMPPFQMMPHPVFQQPMNLSELQHMSPMRFHSKEMGSMENVPPPSMIPRIGPHPFHHPTFAGHHYVTPLHHSQFFDNSDEPPVDIAFLDYSGGVVYDNGPFSHGGRWLTFWEYKGRIWRKSFAVSLYGNEGAKELAENFWVSKMRAIQLFNRNKQEKMMKMEKPKETRGRRKKVQQEDNPIHMNLDPLLATQYALQEKAKEAPEPVEPKHKKEVPVEEADFEIPVPKPREPRDDIWEVEGLTWDRLNSCWSFEKIENDELLTFRFPCENREDGLKEISNMKNDYEYALLNEYKNIDIPGVVYDKAKMNWKVSYWVPSKGVKRYKIFSVTKLGYKDARDAAIAFRKALDESGGEEPEDMTPDPVPQEELLADPIVNHYHKVLSSIAVKELKDVLS